MPGGDPVGKGMREQVAQRVRFYRVRRRGVAAQAASGAGFDVEQLLRERATVYMLGADDGPTAPLVTALTGHIARQARALAGRCVAGRLDPPLTLALDEAALICPIPLDNWTADMGGRGVTIHIAAQSRAQLRRRHVVDLDSTRHQLSPSSRLRGPPEADSSA